MNGKTFQLSFIEKKEAFYSKALVLFCEMNGFCVEIGAGLIGSQKSESRE